MITDDQATRPKKRAPAHPHLQECARGRPETAEYWETRGGVRAEGTAQKRKTVSQPVRQLVSQSASQLRKEGVSQEFNQFSQYTEDRMETWKSTQIL